MALKPDKLKTVIAVGIGIAILALANTGAETKLTLPDAIRLSQEHSYGIKSSRCDSLSAVYDLRAAQSLRFPTASLTGNAFHINKLQSIDLPITRISMGAHDNYQADFRVSVPLLTGGRIANQIEIRRQFALAEFFNLEAERLSNAYLARKAYLNLMISHVLANSATSSLKRVELIREDVQNRYANGLADSVDLLEAELARQKTDQAHEVQLAAIMNTEAALVRLIGMPSSEHVVYADSIPAPDFSSYEGHALTIDDIDRPELKAIGSNVRVGQLAVNLSKAAYYPTLNGYGGYSVGKPNKDLFNKTWNDFWTAGLVLNWDFNLGGDLISKTMSSEQAANSAQMILNDKEESFLLQANIALENLALAYKSYNISSKQFQIAQQEYRLAENKLHTGQLSVNRLLELEADLTSNEMLYRASMINYFISETEYLYAIGSSRIYGGF